MMHAWAILGLLLLSLGLPVREVHNPKPVAVPARETIALSELEDCQEALSFAPEADAIAVGNYEAIAKATEKLLAHPELAHATIGLVVYEVEGGRLVHSHNANSSLVPASTLKLVTTATALHALGPDFRFKTELAYRGTIVDSVLKGDLIIVGGGVPSLGAGRPGSSLDLEALLDRWVGTVKRLGIKKIEGAIVGDDSSRPGAEPSPYWQWNDIGNYYGAGVGALMINENAYQIRFRQNSRQGAQPEIVGIEPKIEGLNLDNRVTNGASGSGDQAYIFGAPGTMDRVIRGTIPVGKGHFSIKGSLPDPALQTAQWLKERLDRVGIPTSGKPASTQVRYAGLQILDTYHSPTLAELAELTNHKSVNLYADAMLAALASRWGIKGGLEESNDKLLAFWEDRGINTSGWDLKDGSGLSAANLITAAQMGQVLRKSAAQGLPASLPRVGAEGTVAYVLRGDPRARRLRAKSGTLSRARSFAGYATRSDGTELAFVVMANNFSGGGSAVRNAMAQWMAVLAE